MAHDHRSPIVCTPFRTLPAADGRTRTVFLTESRKGNAVRVENYDRDGRQVGGTLQLTRDDLPAFVETLTDAAAAIGVEIPAVAALHPDGVALDRYLSRGRAL